MDPDSSGDRRPLDGAGFQEEQFGIDVSLDDTRRGTAERLDDEAYGNVWPVYVAAIGGPSERS